MYKPYANGTGDHKGLVNQESYQDTHIQFDGDMVSVQDSVFLKDANFARDGSDLTITNGDETLVIDGYFNAETIPDIQTPDGQVFTGNFVNSFIKSAPQYAANGSVNDESPVGAVQEINGKASITRLDGSVEDITLGTPIYEGDIVETGTDSAINILFVDETNFAVSDNARLSIDEYVYDSDTSEGTTDFSVLKGLFVYTSGVIGREDPDDVNIDTPMGSIGIRGTIIAGDTNNGEITVVEGAIVLSDFSGNEVTLANQFETAKFDPSGGKIDMIGTLNASDIGDKFESVADVSGSLFSSIQDSANDSPQPNDSQDSKVEDQVETQEGKEIEDGAKQDSSINETEQTIEQDGLDTDQSDEDAADEASGDAEGESAEEQPEGEVAEELEAATDANEAAENKLMNGKEKSMLDGMKQAQNKANTTLNDMNVDADSAREMLTEITAQDTQIFVEPIEVDTNLPPSLINAGRLIDGNYFTANVGQNSWSYNFGSEIKDDGQIVGFRLSAQTVKMLNDNDVLDGSGNAVTSKSITNDGLLDLDFTSVSQTTGLNDAFNFKLKIFAIDNEGKATSFNFGGANGFEVRDANDETGVEYIDGFNGSVPFSDSILFLDTNVPAEIVGDNNMVHLLSNQGAKLTSTASNNTFFGNAFDNTITIDNNNNKVFSADGNDVIELTKTTNFNALTINGGSNATVLNNDGTAIQSLGDAIKLNISGGISALNFSNLTQNIRNIETLDLTVGSNDISNLNYNNVLHVTDENNILIVTGQNNDQLSSSDNWSDSGKDLDFSGRQFDVWTQTGDQGTVTLLVEQNIDTTGL